MNPTPDNPDQAAKPAPTLRDKVMQGGRYMIGRQMCGMVISVVGVILLTRMIGPGPYGVYAAALGVMTYLMNVSLWGIDTYLIRERDGLGDEDFDQAFTLLLLISGSVMTAAILLLPLIDAWVSIEDFSLLAILVFAGLPVAMVSKVPMAYLESKLEFKKVAMISFGAQLIYQPVSLGLAYRGAGAFAPLAGWWSSLLFAAVMHFWVSGYRPHLAWNRDRIRSMLGYGLSYAASMWVWQLRTLVNPLIVGRFGGAEAVGQVALALRMTSILRFAQSATWRLAIAALAKVQNDTARLRRAVEEGSAITLLLLGPAMAGFGLLGPFFLERLLGPRWLASMEVFPFIAAGVIFNATFALQASALFVVKQNWRVAVFHFIHVVMFAGGVALGMGALEWNFVWAIGLGEGMGLLSYAVLHLIFTRVLGSPRYGGMLLWATGFSLISFWPILGWPALLGAALIVLNPQTWTFAGRYMSYLPGRRFCAVAAD
ncbi:MAG: oligosaccharide flippase family protein [Planctomycetota bacterium]